MRVSIINNGENARTGAVRGAGILTDGHEINNGENARTGAVRGAGILTGAYEINNGENARTGAGDSEYLEQQAERRTCR